MSVRSAAVILVALVLLPPMGCQKKMPPGAKKTYTMSELKGMVGKTREEVRDMLGVAKGLYTFDAKGRWHYANVPVLQDGGPPKGMSVIIYFSEIGDQRVTTVDVVESWKELQQNSPDGGK